MSSVLKDLKGVCSYHEPEPVLNGWPMVLYQLGFKKSMKKGVKNKIEKIKAHTKEENTYIETNHLFIKGFGWEIINHLPHQEIGIIFLRKDKTKIISSLRRIRCTPLSVSGLRWLYFPYKRNKSKTITVMNLMLYPIIFVLNKIIAFFKLKQPKYIIEYETRLLNWYVDETFNSAHKFKLQHPQIKFYETTVENLNSIEGFKNLFNHFELEFTPNEKLLNRIGKKTNRRDQLSSL